MYRGQEPAFCRACGTPWTPGRQECTRCGEPAAARPASEGRSLPAFTHQGRLTRALTGLTGLYAAALLAELLTGLGERGALTAVMNGTLARPEALAIVARREWASLAAIALYLPVIVLFGVWVVRAGRNLRARGILDTRDIEEARILWFFVPVVHLWRPLLGLRELWQGSRTIDPGQWQAERVPTVLWIWWPVWLLSNALGNGAMWSWYHAHTPRELLAVNELELWRVAVRLACVPLFLAVVWGIERAQQARRG